MGSGSSGALGRLVGVPSVRGLPFCGRNAPLTRALQKQGWVVISIDIVRGGPDHDLSQPGQETLKYDMMLKVVPGVM